MKSKSHTYYSQRKGTNPHKDGLPLEEITQLFERVYDQMREEGLFTEALGFYCVDAGDVPGKIQDVELEILIKVRKRGLWPIGQHRFEYSEDDFFDLIEFLFQIASFPLDGTFHNYSNCGMHWTSFNPPKGQAIFRGRVNELLRLYARRFELSSDGEILELPEAGTEALFQAPLVVADANVSGRVAAAISRFRRHGATLDDRHAAVRDLADVLEYMREDLRKVLSSKDESDLFNIANSFGIRHHNDKQRTKYDRALWLSWMFYFYLATIHYAVRRLALAES